MNVVKRSVSFDAELWDELEREVGRGAVSPLVNDALALFLRRQRGLAAVAAFELEHGSFTEAELADADDALDAAGVVDLLMVHPSKRPRKRARSKGTPKARRSRS